MSRRMAGVFLVPCFVELVYRKQQLHSHRVATSVEAPAHWYPQTSPQGLAARQQTTGGKLKTILFATPCRVLGPAGLSTFKSTKLKHDTVQQKNGLVSTFV